MPSSINPYIQTILNAIYGKDVRQAIADGIQLCYTDAISGVPTQAVLGDADLDDYVDSGIWNLVTGHTYQNSPVTSGLLEVVRISDGAIHQIVFSRANNMYMRSKYSGNDWNTWAPLLDTPVTISVTGKNISSASAMVAPYDDADTIPPNEILSYANVFPANFPKSIGSASNEACTVITFGRSKEATSLMLQIIAHGSATSRQSKIDLYYRLAFVNSSSEIVWRNWERINAPSVKMTPELFEKIAVLGDSYASGMTSDSTPRYHCSWLQMLCRQYGCVGENYSRGSLTSRSWFTSVDGYPKFSADTELYNLYFVAFGINDSNTNQSWYVPLGTVDDITTSDYADTFYGNMAHIHDVIMEKNPNAKICFITPMRIGGRYDAYADAVVNLANHYGCLLIDSRNIPLFNMSWWDDKLVNNHPTVEQYSAIANAVAEELSNAIFRNPSYVGNYDPSEGSTGGGGSLSRLSDVDLSNLTNGQVITYDSASAKWKNVTLGGGGSVQIDSALSSTSENPVQNKAIYTELQNKANTSSLASVATSGSYNDLSNKPTIPTTSSTVTAGDTNPVNSVAVIAYINSLDATNTSY